VTAANMGGTINGMLVKLKMDLDKFKSPLQSSNFVEKLKDMSLEHKGAEKKRVAIREIRRHASEKEDEGQDEEHAIAMEAKTLIEERGIIVIDEIDKIVRDRTSFRSADASDEGVQRDLLPIVEGTVVPIKQSRGGPAIEVRTDFILFIAAGAFSHCKPADLLPEFQGRFPIRAELLPLTEEALLRILKEPKTSLVKQQVALMATEGLDLVFEDDALAEVARVAYAVNVSVQNLGARRLSTILELVLADVSFDAPELVAKGQARFAVTKALVESKTKHLIKDGDVSKYIL
jgi:ATP-dependent HslUV protease ATP-binding subunit HslU